MSTILLGREDQTYALWAEQIKLHYNKTVFMYVLFTSWNEKELQYGEKIQKFLCQRAGIPEPRDMDFWKKKGQETIRQAMNSKRVTIVNAIKKQMRGKESKVRN